MNDYSHTIVCLLFVGGGKEAAVGLAAIKFFQILMLVTHSPHLRHFPSDGFHLKIDRGACWEKHKKRQELLIFSQ